ncbi:MAG: hypothetical protein HGB30_11915 [Holophagaceae bacterium]|nr:hypothetical protein [Holophagaceae bacterium]
MNSESLWRATLHDFSNLLAGLQGVLDLSDPRLPLDARSRSRLECTLEDGKVLIGMARAMALSRPYAEGMVSWPEWRAGLDERMQPMAMLYRCPIEIIDNGEAGAWPAPLLQDWAAAFTRQILPWAAPGPLRLEARIQEGAWTLTWPGDAPFPAALQPELPSDTLMNLPSLWLREMTPRLGIVLVQTDRGLVARMPCP